MKKIPFLFAILIFSMASCSGPTDYAIYDFFYRQNPVEERSGSIKDLGNVNPKTGTKYTVLLMSDVHFGGENTGHNSDRKDLQFFEWLKNYKIKMESAGTPELYPSFVVSLGDVVEHGYESEFAEYERFQNLLKDDAYGNLTVYNTVGNHDLYNDGWHRWKQHCYPHTSFYKFRTQNMTFYFLDNASNAMGEKQLTALQRDMKYLERGRKKLAFAHIPLYASDNFYFVMQDTEERNRLISMLADENAVAFIDGHTHEKSTSNLGFTEYTIPGFLQYRKAALMLVDESNPQSPEISVNFIDYN